MHNLRSAFSPKTKTNMRSMPLQTCCCGAFGSALRISRRMNPLWSSPEMGILYSILYIYIYVHLCIYMFSTNNLYIWLVVFQPLWKMMEWVTVGIVKFPTEWKNRKFMFQTTNQLYMFSTNHLYNYWATKFWSILENWFLQRKKSGLGLD